MVAAAVIGGSVLGIGASIYAGNKASGAASQATAAQVSANDQNLAFQQQQYADWQAVYGPIQDNLSSFYQGLTGDALVASGLKQYEQQFVAAEQNLQRSFAQRGVDSPAQGLLQQQAQLSSAEFKATLRNEAPMQAAAVKQGFLTGNVVNPAAQGISNQLGQQAQFYGQQASQYNQQSVAGYQAAGQAINGGVTAYTQNQQYQQQLQLQQNQQYQQQLQLQLQLQQNQQYQPIYAAPINQPMPSGTITA